MTDDSMSIIEFSEDISTAEAPEPLPAGQYPASISTVEAKISAKGSKYAAVTFIVRPDEFPADYPVENAPDGKVLVYRRCSLEDTPNARWQLRKFCEAIGAVASKRVNITDWIGLDATIEVANEEYEGVMREQVVRVNAA